MTTKFARLTKPDPLERRFFSFFKFDAPDRCWPWLGGKVPAGYGKIGDSKRGTLCASRVSWEITHGQPIPEGMVIRHTCDNPPCVNPSHLIVGTHADNTADMISRGRHLEGLKKVLRKRAARTHCIHGHAYITHGTKDPNGSRRCRECWRIKAQRNRDARSQAA